MRRAAPCRGGSATRSSWDIERHPSPVQALLDTRVVSYGRADPQARVVVGLEYLTSYERMGMVRLSCGHHCSCESHVIDGHRTSTVRNETTFTRCAAAAATAARLEAMGGRAEAGGTDGVQADGVATWMMSGRRIDGRGVRMESSRLATPPHAHALRVAAGAHHRAAM